MPPSEAGTTRIQLCGRLKADVEGRHVTPALRGRQGRVLLAYLVLNRGRPVSRDELIDAIWPDDPADRPRGGAAHPALAPPQRARPRGAGRPRHGRAAPPRQHLDRHRGRRAGDPRRRLGAQGKRLEGRLGPRPHRPQHRRPPLPGRLRGALGRRGAARAGGAGAALPRGDRPRRHRPRRLRAGRRRALGPRADPRRALPRVRLPEPDAGPGRLRQHRRGAAHLRRAAQAARPRSSAAPPGPRSRRCTANCSAATAAPSAEPSRRRASRRARRPRRARRAARRTAPAHLAAAAAQRPLRRPRRGAGPPLPALGGDPTAEAATSSWSAAIPASARRGWSPSSPSAPTTPAPRSSTAAPTRRRLSPTSPSSRRCATGRSTRRPPSWSGDLGAERRRCWRRWCRRSPSGCRPRPRRPARSLAIASSTR